ncbi:Gag-Pol polyprotein [Chionoecetes opilio]|uniref:Gag-Pol polyprotein n=1 Tax=Chionoecetes opilio TaxID=41210 RepID=A0A8J4YJI9_CHIOP|nr:Gag-Pol polyprotein [Chionoecetes opilio]
MTWVNRIELLQNEAMRIIFGCQRNAMIDAMRLELNLPSVCDRIQELNVKSVVKYVRPSGQSDVLRDLQCIRRSKSASVRNVKEHLVKYKVAHLCCPLQLGTNPLPPWEEARVVVEIEPLSMKKYEFIPGYLRAWYCHMVDCLPKDNAIHVFCDGSVSEDGRAGCGILMWDYDGYQKCESTVTLRLSDGISSTQAELYGIYVALCRLQDKGKDVYIFVDSRAALGSLNSRRPVYVEIGSLCKTLMKSIKVTFHWIPSHVGIPQNETADVLAKCGTEKDDIVVICHLSIRQIRSIVRREQYCIARSRMMREHADSGTFRHYDKVSDHVAVTYGKKGTQCDAMKMRMRLGYKYYWQYKGVSTVEETRCTVCGAENGHTLEHYVLRCSCVSGFRNNNIDDVTEQIIWMLQNGVVEEILGNCKDFAPPR